MSGGKERIPVKKTGKQDRKEMSARAERGSTVELDTETRGMNLTAGQQITIETIRHKKTTTCFKQIPRYHGAISEDDRVSRKMSR